MRILDHLPRLLLAPLIAAAALGACRPDPESAAGASNETNQATPAPPLSIVDPPLDRSALLLALARAGSAAALGRDDREAQRQLDGDRFEIRIRFGCPGFADMSDDGAFQIRYQPEKRTLRLRAAPDLIGTSWFGMLGGEDVEAVEGFWLPRPWLLADGCPVPVADKAETSPPDSPQAGPDPEQKENEPTDGDTAPIVPRVGLAQLFRQSDARTQRRDHRAYETTVSLAADEQPSEQGYALILSGRFRRLPDGRVIACRAGNVDMPPDCIASVAVDRVRIERPDNQKVLAEWSG